MEDDLVLERLLGVEDVRGVATTVYAASADVKDYPFGFRAWIDDDGLMRRLEVSTPENPRGLPSPGSPLWSVPGGRQPEATIFTRFDFSDFGTDVRSLAKPRSDEVRSATDLDLPNKF